MAENVIVSNTATVAGGGISIVDGTVTGTNDIIAGNVSPFEGIYISDGVLTARHWTLVDNGGYALTTDAGLVQLSNTIVASHTVAGFAGTGITADHTLFFNSGTPCTNGATCTDNLSGNPHFVSPATFDYHIGPDSDAIDAGIDMGVSRDIDSEPRRLPPDLGADEYWAPNVTWHTLHLPLVLQNVP